MIDPLQYYVIGAGGHAKVIVSAIRSLGHHVVAILDDDVQKHGTELSGVPIFPPSVRLLAAPAYPAVVGIGDNRVRQQVVQRFDLDWATIVHPTAIIDGSVTIGRGSVVMAGAIVQAGATVGEHCIINTAATVDHDCRIDDFAHVASGANLAGHCELGEGVFIGIGACVVPSIRVGEWTTIGAGAAVVGDLPPGVIATGVPARPRRGRFPA